MHIAFIVHPHKPNLGRGQGVLIYFDFKISVTVTESRYKGMYVQECDHSRR